MKGVVSDVVTMILSVDCQSSAMTLINFANKKLVSMPPMIANICVSIMFVTRTKTFACDVLITKNSVDGVILTRIVITSKGIYKRLESHTEYHILIQGDTKCETARR